MAKRTGRKRKPPITLPGMSGRKFMRADVPDPYEPDKTIAVVKASNDTPLTYIHSRHRLEGPGEGRDDGNARFEAGVWMRKLFEIAGGAGAKAIDYGSIKVDTSPAFEGLTDGQAKAFKELALLKGYLGPDRYELLHAVCCDEIPLFVWIGSRDRGRGMPGGMDRLDAYQALRDGLDAVIMFRGVAVGPARAKRVSRGTFSQS